MLAVLLRGLALLVAHAPLRVSYAVAGALVLFGFLLLPEKRRNALENMAWVLGTGASPQAIRRA
ncbi:MAG: hypothetical protein NTZ05_00870, partial [Chloroflexi bacterium]|nr:hypothetical protein [Chloroflexota bacterium]